MVKIGILGAAGYTGGELIRPLRVCAAGGAHLRTDWCELTSTSQKPRQYASKPLFA